VGGRAAAPRAAPQRAAQASRLPRPPTAPSAPPLCSRPPCAQAAAEAGSVECVAALLKEGAPWNALDDDGYCAGAQGGLAPRIARGGLGACSGPARAAHRAGPAAACRAPLTPRAAAAAACCPLPPPPAGDYATASKNPNAIELLLNWGVQCEELLAAMER
jgi:hypothetical protein